MTAATDARAVAGAPPALAAACFASMASMRLCDAMLPALAADFQLGAAQTAGAISVFAIAYGLLQLLAGPLGDRLGKARVVGAAALACGLAGFGAALATTWPWLLLCRGLMGATAAGIVPLTLAWIGDQVPWDRRQVALARLLSWTVTGMMAGAWAGGALTQALGWRATFACVGVLLMVAGAVALWHRPADAVAAGGPQLSYRERVALLLRERWPRQLYALALLEGAAVFGVIALVPSLLHERFALPLGAAGGTLALFGLGGLLYSRAAGWLLKRLSMGLLATSGGMLLAAAFGTLALMPHWGFAVPACVVAGLGFYLLHGGLQTCATQLSAQARGTAVSLFACVLFIGQSLGVSAVAWLAAHQLAAAALLGSGASLLLLSLGFARGVRRSVAS